MKKSIIGSTDYLALSPEIQVSMVKTVIKYSLCHIWLLGESTALKIRGTIYLLKIDCRSTFLKSLKKGEKDTMNRSAVPENTIKRRATEMYINLIFLNCIMSKWKTHITLKAIQDINIGRDIEHISWARFLYRRVGWPWSLGDTDSPGLSRTVSTYTAECYLTLQFG